MRKVAKSQIRRKGPRRVKERPSRTGRLLDGYCYVVFFLCLIFMGFIVYHGIDIGSKNIPLVLQNVGFLSYYCRNYVIIVSLAVYLREFFILAGIAAACHGIWEDAVWGKPLLIAVSVVGVLFMIILPTFLGNACWPPVDLWHSVGPLHSFFVFGFVFECLVFLTSWVFLILDRKAY